MRKKILLSVVLICFFSVAFTEGSGSIPVVTEVFPPYVLENGGGFLNELLREINAKSGLNFTVELMPWARCQVMVKTGLAWGAMPYVKNEERLAQFDFSKKLFEADIKVIYYSEQNLFKEFSFSDNLVEFKPYLFGVVRGYYYLSRLKEAGINYILSNNEFQSLRNLQKKHFDFTLMNVHVLNSFMKEKIFESEQSKFRYLDQSYTVTESYMMVSRKYPFSKVILDKFNQALEVMYEDGTYFKLMKKYCY